jgi:hypothetical protein
VQSSFPYFIEEPQSTNLMLVSRPHTLGACLSAHDGAPALKYKHLLLKKCQFLAEKVGCPTFSFLVLLISWKCCWDWFNKKTRVCVFEKHWLYDLVRMHFVLRLCEWNFTTGMGIFITPAPVILAVYTFLLDVNSHLRKMQVFMLCFCLALKLWFSNFPLLTIYMALLVDFFYKILFIFLYGVCAWQMRRKRTLFPQQKTFLMCADTLCMRQCTTGCLFLVSIWIKWCNCWPACIV